MNVLAAARSVLQAFRLAVRARGLDPELGAVLDDGLALLDEGLTERAAVASPPRGRAPSQAPAPAPLSLSLFSSDLQTKERESVALPPPRAAPPTAETLAPDAPLSPELAQVAKLAECAVSDVAGCWRKFTAMKAGLPLAKVAGGWQKWLVDELRHEVRHQRAPPPPRPEPRPAAAARPRPVRDTEPAIPPPPAFLSVLAGLAKGRPAQGHVQAQGA